MCWDPQNEWEESSLIPGGGPHRLLATLVWDGSLLGGAAEQEQRGLVLVQLARKGLFGAWSCWAWEEGVWPGQLGGAGNPRPLLVPSLPLSHHLCQLQNLDPPPSPLLRPSYCHGVKAVASQVCGAPVLLCAEAEAPIL